MKIENHIYLKHFYPKLLFKFIKYAWDGTLPNGIGENTVSVWEKKDKDGQYISLLLFRGDGTGSPTYFHKKKSEMSEIGITTIDDKALFKALLFLGVNLPNIFDNTHFSAVNTKLLYISYKNSLPNEVVNNTKADATVEINSLAQNITKEATRFVEMYFENLSLGLLDYTWSLLSPKIQKSWNNESAYYYISAEREKSNLTILKTKAKGSTILVTVYYEEMYATNPIQLIDVLLEQHEKLKPQDPNTSYEQIDVLIDFLFFELRELECVDIYSIKKALLPSEKFFLYKDFLVNVRNRFDSFIGSKLAFKMPKIQTFHLTKNEQSMFEITNLNNNTLSPLK